MTSPADTHHTPSPVRLMLVEDDPVFQLGLSIALERNPDTRVVFEANTPDAALRVLQDWLGGTPSTPIPGAGAIAPDMVILSLDLGRTQGQERGLDLCLQLKTLYPQLPILLLGTQPTPLQLATALQSGVEGYCPKGSSLPEIIAVIRRIVSGKPAWDTALNTITHALNQTNQYSPPSSSPSPSSSPPPILTLRQRLHQSGLRQINTTIALLDTQLQAPNLPLVDQLVLTGRRRELRAARWLITRLLIPTPSPSSLSSPPSPHLPLPPSPISPTSPPPPTIPYPLSPSPPSSLRSLQSALFDNIAARLQTGLRNLTGRSLEIDILKLEKKRELLLVILRKLEEVLDDLRFSQVPPNQLAEKQPAILQNLWQATMTDFFGRYYTLQMAEQPIEIVEILLQDWAIVQGSILNKIPLVPELLAHLLYEEPLWVDDVAYPVGTVEAMVRLEMLMQNLTVQVANAVVQPLLNRFGNVEAIKLSFYDRRLLSTREVERFRNDLSWRYRVEQWVDEPTAIFESRFNLITLTEAGLVRSSIYAPRNEELAQLSGIPFVVTLALEARDAISPRLRSAISFLGSGVVYILTDVLGRGIGLVGRGIVKGIGNALQDVRLSRTGDRFR
jgi:DNA-binding NarL/FixJ family response regulator